MESQLPKFVVIQLLLVAGIVCTSHPPAGADGGGQHDQPSRLRLRSPPFPGPRPSSPQQGQCQGQGQQGHVVRELLSLLRKEQVGACIAV